MKANETAVRRTASAILIAAAALAAAGCKQSPLFYEISKETEPREASVKGNPSAPVAFDGKLWVANGRLHSYDGANWSQDPSQPPSDSVSQVAANGTHIYARPSGIDDRTAAISRRAAGAAGWVLVPTAAGITQTVFQGLFSANGEIFATARTPDTDSGYALLRVVGDQLFRVSFAPAKEGDAARETVPSAIVGVVHDGTSYYVATVSDGIFRGDLSGPLSAVAAPSGLEWKDAFLSGMTVSGTQVIAAGGLPGKDGRLVWGSGTAFKTKSFNVVFKGALAVYSVADDPKLIVAGISSGTTVYGYREFPLAAGVLPDDPQMQEPGKPASGAVSTVLDADRYRSSLGQIPVEALVQLRRVADGEKVLFASTVSKGLYSLRGDVWNAY